MSDVTETLQELMERRLRELGHRRGRGESLSLREAYTRMLEEIKNNDDAHPDDEPVLPTIPTYEVFRRIRNGQTRISDAAASALATMLGVAEEDIFRAAGIPPRLGRFELPTSADRLTRSEREAVLAVVDAILSVDGRNQEPSVDLFWDDRTTGIRLFAQVKNSTGRLGVSDQGAGLDRRQVAGLVRETVSNSWNAIQRDPGFLADVAGAHDTSVPMAARTIGRAPSGQQSDEERAAELGLEVVRPAQEEARRRGTSGSNESSDEGVTGS